MERAGCKRRAVPLNHMKTVLGRFAFIPVLTLLALSGAACAQQSPTLEERVLGLYSVVNKHSVQIQSLQATKGGSPGVASKIESLEQQQAAILTSLSQLAFELRSIRERLGALETSGPSRPRGMPISLPPATLASGL